MSKLIHKVVENCWQCPYTQMIGPNLYCDCLVKDVYNGGYSQLLLENPDTIPDWCPLPNSEKK